MYEIIRNKDDESVDTVALEVAAELWVYGSADATRYCQEVFAEYHELKQIVEAITLADHLTDHE